MKIKSSFLKFNELDSHGNIYKPECLNFEKMGQCIDLTHLPKPEFNYDHFTELMIRQQNELFNKLSETLLGRPFDMVEDKDRFAIILKDGKTYLEFEGRAVGELSTRFEHAHHSYYAVTEFVPFQ
ncbi:hypothetical protein [Flagellimonas sp.]|uniref:hypothetical protein n=1 Tax=Flagellimonas sp. TaxID=2058762 RepID=UPI003BA89E17